MNGSQESPMCEDVQNASLTTLIEKRKIHAERQRKYRLENKQKVKDSIKRWKAANKSKNAEYDKRWREKNKGKINKLNKEARKRWNEKNHDKLICYNMIHLKESKGEIDRSTKCSHCGDEGTRIEGHHFDYTKPYELTWLCYRCHREIHRKDR